MKRNLTTVSRQTNTWLTARPLLGKLIRWTVWIILALTLTAVILYVAGAYRGASDDSQLALVRFCLVSSLLLIISSFYGLALDLFCTIRRRRAVYLAGALGYVVLMALGAVLALGAAFIIGAVGGNR